MNLAPLVQAARALMSPLEWDGEDAWLAECLRRVRESRGLASEPAPEHPLAELERLLQLPGDEPGWLRAAFADPGWRPQEIGMPPTGAATEAFLTVMSLRCALAAGLATLARLEAMDRAGTWLPTTQELRITFGLRGREPQVALLAAEGLSNADIAERLRLSAHTVRHYLERVLDRLGLHTRKALAVHLIAGAGERPQPLERKSPLT
jgi:DNA-binding CsgD family transcriptional regulator